MRRWPRRSTNLLALADGTIYRTLPTVPGTTYTLCLPIAGRAPSTLWRGETNALDSIDAINGNNLLVARHHLSQRRGGKGVRLRRRKSVYVNVPDSLSWTHSTNITVDPWIKSCPVDRQRGLEGLVRARGKNSWRLQPAVRTPKRLTGTWMPIPYGNEYDMHRHPERQRR